MQHTRLFLASCLLVVGGLYTSLAVADDNLVSGTGNELIEFCSQANYTADNSNWFACVVYVHGVYDGFVGARDLIISVKAAAPAQDQEGVQRTEYLLGNLICMPANVTRQQMALVVTKYLSDNPAQLNYSAASDVLTALAQAWPCKQGK
jgi:Rap1a immunity proteins